MGRDIKKIAVLTSGGDSPGMNAAIRAVVRKGIYHGFEVYGVQRGYKGLINGDLIKLNRSSVSEVLHRGGTFLKSARCLEFIEEEGQQKALRVLKEKEIDAVVVIGGDGSYKGAKKLHEHGIKTIALPGTIDNDLGYTDYTIGFDTAITTVIDAVSKIRDTSSSHERAFIIEVMGRHCGDIALYAGLASGAETVIVPEIGFNLEEVVDSIRRGRILGKSHNIILLAEGIGNPYDIKKQVEEKSGEQVRLAVIGHLQRGGSPTAFDRILATRMGAKAIDLLLDKKSGVAVGIEGNNMIYVDLDVAINKRDNLNMELFELAEILDK